MARTSTSEPAGEHVVYVIPLLLGAVGGAFRGVLRLYDCMNQWLGARHEYRLSEAPERHGPPLFTDYYDPLGESVAVVVHAVLGAAAAWLTWESGQARGVFALFAAGIAAPTIFVQLRNTQLGNNILGAHRPDEQPAIPYSPEVDAVPDSRGGGVTAHQQPPAAGTSTLPEAHRTSAPFTRTPAARRDGAS